MDKHTLNSLNPMKFTELVKKREMAIAAADAATPVAETSVNKLAGRLHTRRQYLTVSGVTEQNGCKTFLLKPDETRGTKECAYFSAGQYLTVYVEIGGKQFSRPYSIVSSPRDTLRGFYRMTVKAVKGGLVSNYILDHWEVGTPVTVSDPIGTFSYEPLRDAAHVIGIAGGSGITPFVSLAKAIAEGDEECSLTLLYGSRTEKDILFREELDSLCAECDKLRVVHVLSDEQKDGCEYGFVTESLIQKYAPNAPYTIFLCGPRQMTAFVDQEIEKLGLERKYIRHEVHGETASLAEAPDTPVRITVTVRGNKQTVSGSMQDSVLRILENNGITPPSRCRSGECGFCHSRLISGKVYTPADSDQRRQADEQYGYIHPCCSYPLSDLEIEVSEGGL